MKPKHLVRILCVNLNRTLNKCGIQLNDPQGISFFAQSYITYWL